MEICFDDVWNAAKRLQGIVHRTPIVTSRTLDNRTGAKVFCKCENFQRTGSFKFRGAYHTLSLLAPESTRHGILAYSSGNHAQAIALAAKLKGASVTVIMPDAAPRIKLAATRGYGANIVTYDRRKETREAVTMQMAATTAVPVVPPYDHPHIIPGQGTAGLELLQDSESLDYLLAPCGGGGLLSGTALAAHGLQPQCQVVGVEPANADDATRSFRTGILHTVDHPDTIADGARTPSLGKITFPIIRRLVHNMVTVTEDQILEAVLFLWERMKLVVEPTGSLGVAALLGGSFRASGARIGVIISGGNVDLNQWAGSTRC